MRNGAAWTEQAKLTASDAGRDDWFGISVAISQNYAIIGAMRDDDDGTDSGSAYVFMRNGAAWTEQAKLTASDAAAHDRFSESVGISGDYAIVGASLGNDNGSGSAYVFESFTFSGTVTLVDENPPLQWNYQLTHNSGDVTRWSYTGAGITGAGTSGQALAVGWRVHSQTAKQVVFTSETPLTSGSLAGFHITGINGGTGTWQAGVNLGSVDGSLPVELSRFTAQAMSDGVRLDWQTASETNNLGFHVYRSTAKDGEYVRITPTLIKGHGTDAAPHDYRFLDDTAEEGKTYWYFIEDVDFAGNTDRSDPIAINPNGILLTSWGEIRQTALHQNYPNPFNPETWIPYQLASNASVSVLIYDASGRRIRVLDLGAQPTGSYVTKEKAAYWDGKNDDGESVSSGIYYYQMSAGDFQASKKMLVLK
jgi:hypothetical protein